MKTKVKTLFIFGTALFLLITTALLFWRRNILNVRSVSQCGGGNASNQFYVVFKAGVSLQIAEETLAKYNVKTLDPKSLPPDSYKFKLNDNKLCDSLARLYKEREVFRIPSVYWEPNIGETSNTYKISCPDVPSSFITQNGAVQPSNTFIVTFYQNKDKLGDLLTQIGAFDISGGPKSETEKEKTYYVTFAEGQAIEACESLGRNRYVKNVGNVPWMPTVN